MRPWPRNRDRIRAIDEGGAIHWLLVAGDVTAGPGRDPTLYVAVQELDAPGDPRHRELHEDEAGWFVWLFERRLSERIEVIMDEPIESGYRPPGEMMDRLIAQQLSVPGWAGSDANVDASSRIGRPAAASPDGPRPAVAYLDVDDVLVRWIGPRREGAPHAGAFLRWLLLHFEVRWITSWCPGGTMREDRLRDLAALVGLDPEELRRVRNPLPFTARPFGYPPKHEAVDWVDRRPWVWIEDERGLHRVNREVLDARGVIDRFIPCDTSARPDDLLRVRSVIEVRFGIAAEG